ncbi:hypothetical protein M8C21_009822 [Ambrosia artemisiifolia]|uniref:AMP-activated protein kinase glycogen-binding domain-containing protein n=1 Tax=Ambrosia artemisiifolia TaxID=4212 RepID=A0AAD5C4E7_AMBAR|nr:hypothetical protein M8C21_009822 [Ambrosia artemisiifolia]
MVWFIATPSSLSATAAAARHLISPNGLKIRRPRVSLAATALERELLVFMKNSSNPNEFPTKNQLLDAGRLDLVNAVANIGGWLAFGWEDEDYSQSQHQLQTTTVEERSISKEDIGVEATKIDSQLKERREHNSKDLNLDKIRSRLQQMQLELSSAIHSLRSKNRTLNSAVHETHGSELRRLSYVWEFQENEVMKAGDKLRSIRAKLAVLEGKIALSVIDTQKLVEEKQRRIDSARTTLQHLRTTCIFWTHSASEVMLVGSFDGWTSQVKMEKTRTGIFSTSLKLYPGRYEIKFIVDGIWRVDRTLPVVHYNGFENNSLIVHESA